MIRLRVIIAGALLGGAPSLVTAKTHDDHVVCEMVCMPGQFEKLDKCKAGEEMIFESNGTCPAKADKCAPGFQKRTINKPARLKDCAEAKCKTRCRKAS